MTPLILLTTILSPIFSLPLVSAAWSAPLQKPHVEVELVAEARSIRPGLPFWVALRMKMEPGWHTYWVNPGDSGMKTSIAWTLPVGFSAGPIEWPYPHRLPVPPLVNYGYEGEVLLLTRIDPPAELRAGDVRLEAKADWLVCKETCIPGKAKLELDVAVKPGDPAPDPDWAEAFAEARKKLPGEPVGWKLAAEASSESFVLEATAPGRAAFASPGDAEFFPVEAGLIEPASEGERQARGDRFKIELARPEGSKGIPPHVKGVLVLTREGRAIEVDAPVKPKRVTSLATMILFALVGGLILNIMPCVFPVISVKILGFVEISHQDPKLVRKHGLVFCLGTLLSFWALAGLLLALRAGGQSLGWGFQLQSPAFVVCLASLFFFMGLNLLGFFEIGTRIMGVGQGLAARKTLMGSFFSGVLATVVATPCTAPFMGAALGFALSQKPWIAFAIFTAIACGLTLPYLILSFAPGLLRFLPRPGRWMESFKQFLAFPLFLTVLWLAWVLGAQAGVDAVIALFGALIAFSCAVWIRQRWHSAAWSWVLAVLLALAGLAAALGRAGSRAVQPTASDRPGSPNGGITVAGMPAEAFSPQTIASLRSRGHPVFVDFTAAWCVTCQVNERVVFASKEIKDRFASLGIKIVKADWTQRDESITRALEEFGRSGVPLYLVYPADATKPAIVLPEVISPGILIEALNRIQPKG